MLLDLKQVFEIDGECARFEHDIPLTSNDLWKDNQFSTPIHLAGLVENRAGVVMMNYSADFVLETTCDRCLTEIRREFQLPLSHLLANKLEDDDNDNYILVENNQLDIDQLALSDISLELPTKMLCKEDCKGLCPKCGQNLNQEVCGCVTREIDPRLQALSKLLQ